MEREGPSEKWIDVTWTLFKHAHVLSSLFQFLGFFMLVPSQVTSSVKQRRKIFVFTSSQLTYLLQYDRKERETYLLKFIRNIPFLIYKGRMKGKC